MDSSSSSSDESSKYGQDHARQLASRDNYGHRRRDDRKELDRDPHNRHGRSGRDHRDSEREHRVYQKSYHSGRESRDGHDHLKKEDRSKWFDRNSENYSRDRYDNSHRSNNSRHLEWDRKKDRGAQDEKRNRHRSPGKLTSDGAHTNSRDSNSIYMKSTHRTGGKESSGHNESLNRRKLEKEWEYDQYSKELENIPNKGFNDAADKGVFLDNEEQNILDGLPIDFFI